MLRQEYWILHLRPSVRAVAQACALCRLRRASPRAQPLGDLPAERLEAYQRAFAHTGQDYFGPCWVSIGRRREKRWVALYTCLSTRAVHLEVVHTLSTDSAINALRRFAARRGWPQTMYSDNQTSFRAAALELKAAHAEWLPALRDYGLRERMTWRFIAPAAPNQGGSWERLVRTVKNALHYTLRERAPPEEIFVTLLAECEHVVNSRPLTHVPVDPNDDAALTPNDFLLFGAAPHPLVGPCDEADRRKWRHLQALANHFWRRWVQEYFPLLAPRRSSSDGGRQIQVGDCVLIADPASPRNVWPRGRIITVFPGPDHKIRTADVRTKHGTLRRPTNKLVVLVPAEAASSSVPASNESTSPVPASHESPSTVSTSPVPASHEPSSTVPASSEPASQPTSSAAPATASATDATGSVVTDGGEDVADASAR
jgi:transposase InsO family protein